MATYEIDTCLAGEAWKDEYGSSLDDLQNMFYVDEIEVSE